MTIAAMAHVASVPAHSEGPRAAIRFRLLRDGEVTPGPKTVRIYRAWQSVTKLDLVFQTEDGEFTAMQHLDLAALLAQGEWLVAGDDPAPPRRTRASYMTLPASGTYTYNITSGEGGQQGDLAEVSALVRVERLPANREIVLVERPADGEWRMAGYGPTPGGSGDIDVRVVGGDVYAIGVDDYGVVFAPDLAVLVGQRIRPTTYAGWLYQITEAGTLPATEPVWWPAEGENAPRQLGTARAVAVRYYRPLAHGPITVEYT